MGDVQRDCSAAVVVARRARQRSTPVDRGRPVVGWGFPPERSSRGRGAVSRTPAAGGAVGVVGSGARVVSGGTSPFTKNSPSLKATTAKGTASIGAQEPVITIINTNLITHVDDLFSVAVLKHGLEIDKMKVSDFHRAMAEPIGGALDKKAKRAIKGRLTELMMDPQQHNVADEIGLIFKLDGKEGKETKVCLRDIGSYVKFTSECYHKGLKSGTDYTNLSAQLFAAPKGNR